MMKDGSMKIVRRPMEMEPHGMLRMVRTPIMRVFLPRLSVCNRSGPATGYWY